MTAGQALTAILGAALAFAAGANAGGTVVTPKDKLEWKEVVPGVSRAVVEGDPDRGPSRFFLKYKAGLVTPSHRHSADHHVVVVSGALNLTVEGKEHRLVPGSYFALMDKAQHLAKVEGEDCVMFIEAKSAWDVVVDK